MQQVALITAYKEFDYLKRLALNLSNNKFAVYIHIDKKFVTEEILNELNSIENVSATSFYKIPWGGIQHLSAVLLLLSTALKENPDSNYFHVITGQDCLCRNSDEFFEFFSADNRKNYMSCNFSESMIFRYKTFYRNDWLNYKSKIGNFCTKALHILQKSIGINRKPPNNYKIYKGVLYVSITNEFGKYIIDFLKTKDGKKIYNWIKWCFIPEEFFFQTVLMNSPFADTLEKKNYRFALWKEKHGTSPGIIDGEDYSAIKESGCFFARKISSKYSVNLLQMLEK